MDAQSSSFSIESPDPSTPSPSTLPEPLFEADAPYPGSQLLKLILGRKTLYGYLELVGRRYSLPATGFEASHSHFQASRFQQLGRKKIKTSLVAIQTRLSRELLQIHRDQKTLTNHRFHIIELLKTSDLDTAAELLKATASTTNRLYTYLQLYNGEKPKHIAQKLDVTRNALQHYIDDWKELGLLEVEGHRYYYTPKGKVIVQNLERTAADLEYGDSPLDEEQEGGEPEVLGDRGSVPTLPGHSECPECGSTELEFKRGVKQCGGCSWSVA